MAKQNAKNADLKPYKLLERDLERFALAIDHWRNEAKRFGDSELARTHIKDANDLTDFLELARGHEFRGAWKRLFWLDTIVRDQVPVRLYNFLAKQHDYI